MLSSKFMCTIEVEQITRSIEDSCVLHGEDGIQILDQDVDNILFNDCKYYKCSLSFIKKNIERETQQ